MQSVAYLLKHKLWCYVLQDTTGIPPPQCWTAGQTQPSIREILVGLWWIRTARLVYHLTIYNETKPAFLGRKTYAEKWRNYNFTSIVNVVVESVELQAVGVNTAIISGTAALFTMISCVMQSSIDYCLLLPHLKHPGHQGLAFAVPSNTLSFAAWLLLATQEFFTLDVTLRQQFVCEVVSQLMQFPGCNKVGLRIWRGVFSGPTAE